MHTNAQDGHGGGGALPLGREHGAGQHEGGNLLRGGLDGVTLQHIGLPELAV